MQRLQDLPRLRKDLATGNRLTLDPALQLLVLSQLERTILADVNLINQGYDLSSTSTQEHGMREVKDLAAGMKGLLADLRSQSVNAKNELVSEVNRGIVNAQKAKSMAQELKTANKEVEEFLGESGSNFSGSEDSSTQKIDGLNKIEKPDTVGKTDINGVTLNTEAGK